MRKRISQLVLPRFSPLLDRMNWSARWTETVRASPDCAKFSTRQDLFANLYAEKLGAGSRAIDYMEFGVFEGKSLEYLCALDVNPASRFFGFDSFEGLPESWNGSPPGTYSAKGKLPDLVDSRVEFVVGWFQSTLPEFLATYQPNNPLVIHNDSDLYTSTLFVLTALNSLIRPGTLVIFDEFYDPVNEFRALYEYAACCMRKFKLVSSTANFVQAAVEIL